VNCTDTLQDRDIGGEMIWKSNRYFINLKWCVVLDWYKRKVFTKQRNRKLFTRRHITFQSQFQPRYSSEKHNIVEMVVEPVGLMWCICSICHAFINVSSCIACSA